MPMEYDRACSYGHECSYLLQRSSTSIRDLGGPAHADYWFGSRNSDAFRFVWATGRGVEGFTTVTLLLLGIGAVLMISLGIIRQYLAKIYDELKAGPRHLIARQLRIDTSSGDRATAPIDTTC